MVPIQRQPQDNASATYVICAHPRISLEILDFIPENTSIAGQNRFITWIKINAHRINQPIIVRHAQSTSM